MKQIKLKFGNGCKFTCFGLRTKSHGMYFGGYEYYVYGIKNLISFEILKCWGQYNTLKL